MDITTPIAVPTRRHRALERLSPREPCATIQTVMAAHCGSSSSIHKAMTRAISAAAVVRTAKPTAERDGANSHCRCPAPCCPGRRRGRKWRRGPMRSRRKSGRLGKADTLLATAGRCVSEKESSAIPENFLVVSDAYQPTGFLRSAAGWSSYRVYSSRICLLFGP